MTDGSPKGVFETIECGVVEMYVAPEGKNIPRYVSEIQVGKNIRCIKHGAREMMIETLTLFALKKSKNNQLMSPK